MKNTLIITQDFPPNLPKIGFMVRMTELANFLTSKGIKVNVLACKRSKEWRGLLDVDENVSITFIKLFSSYFDIPREDSKFPHLVYKVLKKLIMKIFRNSLIDIVHLDISKYLNEAIKIIVDKDIQNVIISSPPSSLLLIGKELKKKFGSEINIILDYRDAWTLRKQAVEGKGEKTLQKLKVLEQDILSNSDNVIFVSEGMLQVYLESFTLPSAFVIENGFIDCEVPEPAKEFKDKINDIKKEGKLILGFFGTGSADGRMPYKDFGNLIKVLRQEHLAEKVCLVVQGHVSFPKLLPESLTIFQFPPTSNVQARANMKLVDIGLVVHSEVLDAPQVMGGKLYDYMASGIPIWVLAPDNCYSLKSFIKKTNKPFFSNIFDLHSIRMTLQKIIELREEDKLRNYSFTNEESNEYSRRNQYSKIINILK